MKRDAHLRPRWNAQQRPRDARFPALDGEREDRNAGMLRTPHLPDRLAKLQAHRQHAPGTVAGGDAIVVGHCLRREHERGGEGDKVHESGSFEDGERGPTR